MSTDIDTNNNLSSFSSDNAKTNESVEDKSIKSNSDTSNTIQKLNKSAESEIKDIPFYKLNLLEMTIELKNTWFGILDDLLTGNITLDIILKDNRLFYVGFTILIIAIILYIYDYAINPNDPFHNLITNGNGIVEIRHIYEKRN